MIAPETTVTFTLVQDGRTVTISETDCITLQEYLELFETFLRACSFHFDGVVDIVKEDE